MNCIFNQINGAFHNYLSLYIGDNDNNTTFLGSFCLFVALVVTFALSLRSGVNVTTRATNKQYMPSKSHVIALFAIFFRNDRFIASNIYKNMLECWRDWKKGSKSQHNS